MEQPEQSQFRLQVLEPWVLRYILSNAATSIVIKTRFRHKSGFLQSTVCTLPASFLFQHEDSSLLLSALTTLIITDGWMLTMVNTS